MLLVVYIIKGMHLDSLDDYLQVNHTHMYAT